MAKKAFAILLAIAFLITSSGCSASSRAERVSAGWNEALMEIPGVVSARSHYTIVPGMSQSGMVQIVIEAGARSPEHVMLDSLRVFSKLTKRAKPAASVNYSLLVDGSDVLYRPDIVGMESGPSIQSITDFVAQYP